MMLTNFLIPFSAYLIGSLSGAIIIAKIMRQADPRTVGSNNPGATNIMRYAGKTAALATLLFDALKGVLAVGIATMTKQPHWVVAISTLAVILGHMYPVFFKFQGGKGVATSLGALLTVNWLLGLCLLATWIFTVVLFRISSLAALVSALAAPLYAFILIPERSFMIVIPIITVLLLWRHRGNISRLLNGQEGRIG